MLRNSQKGHVVDSFMKNDYTFVQREQKIWKYNICWEILCKICVGKQKFSGEKILFLKIGTDLST